MPGDFFRAILFCMNRTAGRPESGKFRNFQDFLAFLAFLALTLFAGSSEFQADACGHRRRQTPMTRAWIARRLATGSTSFVLHLIKPARPYDCSRTIVDGSVLKVQHTTKNLIASTRAVPQNDSAG